VVSLLETTEATRKVAMAKKKHDKEQARKTHNQKR
jgi:hypothetical protein